MKCKYCGKEYTNKGIHNHERHCKMNPDYDKIDHSYLSKNGKNTWDLFRKQRSDNINKTKHEYTFKCKKCGKEYTLILSEKDYNKGKYRKFCSRTCANSRVHSDETKLRIKNGVNLYNKTHMNNKLSTFKCKICGKEYTLNDSSSKVFCSIECKSVSHKFISEEIRNKLSEAGKKSVAIQSENRRSKNEKYFCELCENYFNNVEHNIQLFNGWDADVIIHDIKYAILWNGVWHYKKIKENHSVEQVQNRDKIKINEIKKYGYIPYIIKDNGKYNKKFVEEQFNTFLSILN